MVPRYQFKVMFQLNDYDSRCMVQIIILLFILTKYVCICQWLHGIFLMRLTDRVRRAKGQSSPTKRKYIDDVNSKRDMVSEWIFIVMYDYYYYHDVWVGVGFQETQPFKLVIRWQNLSTTITM